MFSCCRQLSIELTACPVCMSRKSCQYHYISLISGQDTATGHLANLFLFNILWSRPWYLLVSSMPMKPCAILPCRLTPNRASSKPTKCFCHIDDDIWSRLCTSPSATRGWDPGRHRSPSPHPGHLPPAPHIYQYTIFLNLLSTERIWYTSATVKTDVVIDIQKTKAWNTR